MAATKANLKLARDLISKKDFRGAYDAANQALINDPKNYNGLVFLGLASLEVGDIQKSEEAYLAAINENARQPLAWQGIAKLYERRQQWEQYAGSLLKLAEIFSDSGDALKCAENISKYIQVKRQYGNRHDLIDALSLVLDGSQYYGTLTNVPEPDATAPTANPAYDVQVYIHNTFLVLEEIVRLTEDDERDTIKHEVEKRRTRLGAPPLRKLKEDVESEVYGSSKLEKLYEEVLNHPKTSDEQRRTTEAKLLQRRKSRLWSTPAGTADKSHLRDEVIDMVKGIVLLRIPNDLAWTLYFEMQNHDTLQAYSIRDVRALIEALPDAPLAQLWKAWLKFQRVPVAEDTDEPEADIDDDPLETITPLFQSLPDSILLHRISSYIYWKSQEYEEAVRIAEIGNQLLSKFEEGFGTKLPRVSSAINIIIACSLVNIYPPKHHTKARRLLDELLEQDPSQADCRLSRGYLHQHAKRWSLAKEDFDTVITTLEHEDPRRLEAEEESAWCSVQLGELESGIAALRNVLEVLEATEDQELSQARAWWRLGKAIWNETDTRSFLEAYKCWITALKRSTSFAPAYTSLGIYYSDYAQPPDPVRASKCFQKAFELDFKEVEAARRLVEGFTEEDEWDLAEIVAKRVIEGEGAIDGDQQSVTINPRHVAMNIWAWKVIGLAALKNKKYPEAIQAFQIALRSKKDDSLLWLRLGEAYAEAGRHTAGLRALAQARELDPNGTVGLFQIAQVLRDLGDFQAALDLYDKLLSTSTSASNSTSSQPAEIVVRTAMCSTRLAMSRHEQNTGFLERAFLSCTRVLEDAHHALESEGPSTRILWKIISDALFELAKRPIGNDTIDETVLETLAKLSEDLSGLQANLDERLLPILDIHHIASQLVESNSGQSIDSVAAKLAVACSSYCTHLAGNDEAVMSSACYDLASNLYELAMNHVAMLGADKAEPAREVAVDYIKRAIRLKSTEPTYWQCLGIITVDSNPTLSQHSFIRAIQCDPKNPLLWSNLGFFYVKCTDYQLAQEAFHKAQILDPDFALSWVGQAVVASLSGDTRKSMNLLEHAVSISADMPIPNLEFGYQTFKSLQTPSFPSGGSNSAGEQNDTLVSAFFALERCLQRRPNDISALHLAALTSERLGLTSRAVTFARRCADILEAAYERSEDPETARKYAITQSTLGRILLVEGNFAAAISASDTVLTLVEKVEEDDGNERYEENIFLRCQAYLVSGIANLLSEEIEAAISSFETGLEETPSRLKTTKTRMTVLLAQTMWNLGTDESYEMAKTILLQSIDSDPKNLEAIVVLGAISTLLNDDKLLDATLSEIISMPAQERRQLDPLRKVDALLLRHHLIQGSPKEALEVARQTLELDPTNDKSRAQLVQVLLQQSKGTAALTLLDTDAGSTSTTLPTLSTQLRLTSLAKIVSNTNNTKEERGDTESLGVMESMEKALFLAPWEKQNWIGLAYARLKNDE